MSLDYSTLILFLAGLFALYIVMWIFTGPIKFLLKSAVCGAVGTLSLWGLNMLTAASGFAIGINLYTALICAFLGVPGFLLILISKMFLG